MKVVIIIISAILLISVVAYGQDETAIQRELTFKLPVSAFTGDFYAESMGVGLGIEKSLNNKFSISQELSYIFHIETNSVLSEDVDDIKGLKLSTEFRKYLAKEKLLSSGWFVGADLKNIFTKSIQESLTDENSKLENNIFRYRGAINANIGILFYWDERKEGRVTLELLGGIGLGYLYANSNLDVDDLGISSNYNNSKGFYPNVNFDFKVGYILK